MKYKTRNTMVKNFTYSILSLIRNSDAANNPAEAIILASDVVKNTFGINSGELSFIDRQTIMLPPERRTCISNAMKSNMNTIFISYYSLSTQRFTSFFRTSTKPPLMAKSRLPSDEVYTTVPS